MEAAKQAKTGQESSHEAELKKMQDLLVESKNRIEAVESENRDLKHQCDQAEVKISKADAY